MDTITGDRDASDRYERRCRLLVRAYPRRWRHEHAEELVGVLLDVAPPGALRPDLRTALDVVFSGWSWRLRHRPPLWRWLLWRTVTRVPRGHRDWARDDVEGALYPLRANTSSSCLMILVFVALSFPSLSSTADKGPLLVLLGFVLGGGVICAALFGPRDRRNARRRLDPEPPLDRSPVAPIGTVPRRRAVAGRWLTVTWAGTAALAAATWWVAAGSRGAALGAVGVVVLAGSLPAAVLALVVVRRVRAPGRLPDQPHRRPTRPHGVLVGLGLLAGGYVGLLGAFAEDPFFRGLVAGAALAVLSLVPAVAALDVVARWLLRGFPGSCPAVRDVLLTALGRPVAVDPPAPLWPSPEDLLVRPSRG